VEDALNVEPQKMQMKPNEAIVLIEGNKKYLHSKAYNYIFDMTTGHFMRWGRTFKEDPQWSPFGAELADIEISTICHGIPSKGSEKPKVCAHCYKSANPAGKNMSLETFKKIFEKLPPTLTQIAFGLGDIQGNPELFDILAFCRERKVIGNLTTNGYGLNDDVAERLVSLCGAVAVSSYSHNKDLCYDSVARLLEANKRHNKNLQVNIHCLLSKETLDFCYTVAEDSLIDPRISEIGAVVFLTLKKVGRGETYNYVSSDEYSKFLNFLFEKEIRFGHDSCTFPNMISHVKESRISKEELRIMCEGCESSRFSLYISVDSKAYPCSFAEHKFEGIDVLHCDDFLKDVWMGNEIKSFRKSLIESTNGCKCEEKDKSCFKCPIYDGVTLCSRKG